MSCAQGPRAFDHAADTLVDTVADTAGDALGVAEIDALDEDAGALVGTPSVVATVPAFGQAAASIESKEAPHWRARMITPCARRWSKSLRNVHLRASWATIRDEVPRCLVAAEIELEVTGNLR